MNEPTGLLPREWYRRDVVEVARDLVGRYRISTWRDPITERYAVTDPGWVEERIAEVRRREAVTA